MGTVTADTTTYERSPVSRLIRQVLTVLGVLFLIIFALVQILPFVFTVANSFKCLSVIGSNPGAVIPVPPFGVPCIVEGSVIPASQYSNEILFNPTLEGYNEILNLNLPRWALNTVIYSVAIMLLRLAFDSLAGYALARMKFPGNRVMFLIVLGTLMVPAVVLLIPRFIILRQLGILNTYQGLIITLAADGFGIFLMKQFFESIPEEIEEAAMVDGASRFRLFFSIVLPMATPALTALAIFSFQGQWNNFLDALVIIGGNQSLWNLPIGLAFLRGAGGETLRWHQFLAGSVLTTLPLAIIFFIFQRYFVEGVAYTGLKG